MNKKMANHFVVLRPEFVEMDMFSVFEGEIAGKNGLIYCHTIKEGARFLDIEAHLAQMANDGSWVHLSIPYESVLYIFAAPDLKKKQDLGFRVDASRSDIFPD